MRNGGGSTISIETIYNHVDFKRGLSEYMKGKPFREAYNYENDWQFERGRQFGVILSTLEIAEKPTLTSLRGKHKLWAMLTLAGAFRKHEII
jgi:hypothetical protein